MPFRRASRVEQEPIERETLNPCLPLPLPVAVLDTVVEDARDFALLHGAGMRTKNNFSTDNIFFAPFTLLPSTFPRSEFEKARDIQTTLNELMYKVAHDYEFLQEALEKTTEVDPFTAKLWRIYEIVREEGIQQELSLGLFRSDYMLTPSKSDLGASDATQEGSPKQKICQIEFNTIASSFGCLSSIISNSHRFVLSSMGEVEKIDNLPENPALQELAGGLAKAWELYDVEKAVIMFVIEEVTYNIADQRYMQFEVQKQNPKIRIIRRTLTEIAARAEIEDDYTLLLDGEEIAVVYYRAGYDPVFYKSDREWDARLLVERSKAIKCPSVNFHLAGTKKVQQMLAKKSVLERFLKDTTDVDRVADVFTGLYSLDVGDEGDSAAKMAIANPEAFVLKPQREGGGNNVYGKNVKKTLEKLGGSVERSGYILMDRIFPPVQKNYIIRPHELNTLAPVEVISELGIFGVLVATPEKIILNRQGGHVLRTKLVTADEGGVSAGVGALDSPFLTD